MNNSIQLCIIGYGNMGRAFVGGLLRRNVFTPEQITVADPSPKKLADLQQTWRIAGTTDNQEAVRGADIVLLAVRSQQMRGVLRGIKDVLQPQTVFISIAARCSSH